VVQRCAPSAAMAPAFSLDDDLRPAIARITARMAFLLVRLPPGLAPAAVAEQARDELAGSGLDDATITALAAPLAALVPPAPALP